MPAASQCHTSICAPASEVHAPPETFDTLNVSTNGVPGFDSRMSLRFSFSSTKYGPSVIAGRTMHDGSVTVVPPDAAAVETLVATGVALGLRTPDGAQAAR